MDDSCLVCGLQRTRDLNRNLQNICILERSIRKVMTKRMAFDKFSSDEVRSISFSNFVNGKNVGVIQRRCGSGFLDEPSQAIFISGEGIRQQLQRDLATKRRIISQVDISHSSSPHRTDDLILSYRLAGFKLHSRIADNMRRCFVCRRLDKTRLLLVRVNQRIDFDRELGILLAESLHEAHALAGFKRNDMMKELF